jgi:hypothetical protein
MFMELYNAIEELNKVSVNLELLKKKWTEIEQLLPVKGGWSGEDKSQYEIKCLEFNDLLEAIPKIRDIKIRNLLPEYDSVSQRGENDFAFGDPEFTIEFYSETFAQDSEISKYEHALKRERRRLIRNQVQRCVEDIDKTLDSLNVNLEGKNSSDPLKPEEINPLKDKIRQLDGLMGDSASRPPRWLDLNRHLHFGLVHDLSDIIRLDWPSIKPSIDSLLYSNDPLPIITHDIGDLVDSADKTGKIGTSLNWTGITDVQFERLCADLIESSPNWENVEWLTPTHASDRGRDIDAFWVYQDATRGTIRKRTLVQCKHRPNKSVSPKDIETLQNLSVTHGKVDLYLVITSGKFSDQVTQIVDRWNERNSGLKVELWEHWKLEQLLASHPYIIKLYGLR